MFRVCLIARATTSALLSNVLGLRDTHRTNTHRTNTHRENTIHLPLV